MKKGFIIPALIIVVAAVALYLFMTKDLKSPSTSSEMATSTAVSTTTTATSSIDKNPLLTPAQEQTLEKIGIDPASLPQTLTPAMISCAREKLGTERTNELINGATPTLTDFYRARSCL